MRRRALTAGDLWLLTILGLSCSLQSIGAAAQNVPPATTQTSSDIDKALTLQLEVFINDAPTGLLGTFRREADGRLTATPAELHDIGLLVAKKALRPDGATDLEKLPGVSFDYDEAAQSIHFTVEEGARAAREIDINKSGT